MSTQSESTQKMTVRGHLHALVQLHDQREFIWRRGQREVLHQHHLCFLRHLARPEALAGLRGTLRKSGHTSDNFEVFKNLSSQFEQYSHN